VGHHYDELDAFYREVWGEHLHHGLWLTGRETPEEAARRLTDVVIREAQVEPGSRVCDVGCGYGATARTLAREHGARVTALTLSAAQLAYARRCARPGESISYRQEDWLANDLPPGHFDAVLAIECVSHMADRAQFYREAYRVLRPGGRLVACVWCAAETPRAWEQWYLLTPIEEEGHLAGLDPMSSHVAWLKAAGFRLSSARDRSREVRRTWRVCIGHLAVKLLTDGRYRRFLLDPRRENRRFAWALPRLYFAYRTGAMRYGFFTAHKPAEGNPARTHVV
jgi:tocopherol O-methyltransferase